MRDHALGKLGSQERPLVAQWFDKLPEASGYYRSLFENPDSLDRVVKVVDAGPSLSAVSPRA